jgi:ectoine hydroxylase-related dioxygenase (phytanoyl-CoA dioxygenase family)
MHASVACACTLLLPAPARFCCMRLHASVACACTLLLPAPARFCCLRLHASVAAQRVLFSAEASLLLTLLMPPPHPAHRYWHRDTDTLSNKNSNGDVLMGVDDFYFTCLMPVSVDITLKNGATEFMVGSHRKTADEFPTLQPVQVCVKVGSALLFNGKMNHRGKVSSACLRLPP